MATTKPTYLLFTIVLVATLQPKGFVAEERSLYRESNSTPSEMQPHFQSQSNGGFWRWRYKSSRRLMIGSTAPTCTYNECKGCRFKCRAEQIPVDANDPINSAYHYKCVCHR